MLRLGDTLDITFERTPIVIYEHLPIDNSLSIDEWQKHLSISGVTAQPEDPLIIKANATCSSPRIHRLLKRIEMDANEQLDTLPTFLNQYRQCTKDLPRRFVLTIKAVGYQAYDFKFTLQENQITKLLMGEKLYHNKDESIRELLKNSVDACRARKESLEKKGLSYSPTIKIIQLAENELLIEDNGIGMNKDTIERYFTKIGTSFYNSTDFSKNFSFTPVSELGIGFLSSFMIAEKITLETKTDEDPPVIIETENVSDFFITRAGERQTAGTSITLLLKKGLSISIEQAIKTFARHIEFPVIFNSFDQKNSVQIIDNGFNPKVFQPSALLLGNNKFSSFYKRINENNLEGILAY